MKNGTNHWLLLGRSDKAKKKKDFFFSQHSMQNQTIYIYMYLDRSDNLHQALSFLTCSK